jgi:hypothetical protein
MIYPNCTNGNTARRRIVDGGASPGFYRRLAATGEEDGCAFIRDDSSVCGAERRPGSPYCADHHALCHIAGSGRRARRRLREEEALATAVGGRLGRPARIPPDPLLRRLENVARGFSRSKCSRIVRGEG